MSIRILFFVANLSIILSVPSVCPNGTITDPNSNNCYKFVSDNTSFNNSEEYCTGIGGHLASVSDAFSNTFIANQAQKFFGNTDTYLWLGGTASLNPGKWSWTDGTNFTYTNWANGQPTGNSGSICTAMRYQSGVWHSEACYGTKPFVCKVSQATVSCPTVMPCVGHLACPPTFMYIDTTQSCYRLMTGGNSFSDYEHLCQGGSKMTSIHSENETNMLVGWLQQYTFNYAWIGLADPSNSGDWEWIDGSDLDYTNWNATWPQGISTANCAQMDKLGTWTNQFECTTANIPTYCRMPANVISNGVMVSATMDSCPTQAPCPVPNLVCPVGFTYIDKTQSCYKVEPALKNFSEAQNACPSGSTMASIHSKIENDMFFNTLFFGLNANNIWIGLHDPLNSGNWHWIDGTPLDYTNWDSSSPHTSTGQNCAILVTQPSWNDKFMRWDNYFVKCSDTYPVLCKIPANV